MKFLSGKISDRIRGGKVDAQINLGRVSQEGRKVKREHTKAKDTEGHKLDGRR